LASSNDLETLGTVCPEERAQLPFERELSILRDRGELRTLREVSGRTGDFALLSGHRLVNLATNDYLGLASDEAMLERFLRKGLANPFEHMAMTSSSSRLLAGNHPGFGVLEGELSALFGGRSALVFGCGYLANLAVCGTLAQRHELILCDRLVHASVLDGARLSGARIVRYRHLDYGHLESLLADSRLRPGKVFVVTESVFSMDGDVADLRRLVELKNEYGAWLVVDEAHAVGVYGENGLGVGEATGVLDQIDVIVGTFGKALASTGAFVVSSSHIRDYLVNRARSFLFTTALPPSVVHWTSTTLAAMVSMRAERRHVLDLAATLRARLRKSGACCPGDSQIVPILVGESVRAVELARRLQDAGFLVFPVRPPTVPPGRARVRLSLTANLTWDRIEKIPRVIEEFLREDGMGSKA